MIRNIIASQRPLGIRHLSLSLIKFRNDLLQDSTVAKYCHLNCIQISSSQWSEQKRKRTTEYSALDMVNNCSFELPTQWPDKSLCGAARAFSCLDIPAAFQKHIYGAMHCPWQQNVTWIIALKNIGFEAIWNCILYNVVNVTVYVDVLLQLGLKFYSIKSYLNWIFTFVLAYIYY